jgi:hypothetical protein
VGLLLFFPEFPHAILRGEKVIYKLPVSESLATIEASLMNCCPTAAPTIVDIAQFGLLLLHFVRFRFVLLRQ